MARETHKRVTSLEQLGKLVCNALSDDLRRPEYRGNPNPLTGHCYVASEAYYHLEGKSKGYRPMVMRIGRGTHWFLARDMHVIDLTASQFLKTPNYKLAKGCGFLTKQPSKRAQIVINRVLGVDT